MGDSHEEQQIMTVIHWFKGWSEMQKKDFMKDLIEKAVPTKMSTLFDALETMNFSDKPPSLFKCQMKLFAQYFSAWNDRYRNDFITAVEQIDPHFVDEFNTQVAATSGQL